MSWDGQPRNGAWRYRCCSNFALTSPPICWTRYFAREKPQGLRFLAAFDRDACVGVAGWRVVANTSGIRVVYVDDLVTDDTVRSHGVGSALLSELRDCGIAAGCRTLELDSGVQRYDAHRFYLRQRMAITAHHFPLDLSAHD